MKNVCMYGCGNPGIIKNKSNSGWRCSKSTNSCPGVKEKKKQMLLDIYGVVNVSQLKSVQNKREETWMKNYGVKNPSKAQVNRDKIKDAWPDTDRKRKETMLEKYGVDSYNKTAEFQSRRKATWVEKYGVDNPTKNADIRLKSMMSNSKSEYRTNTLVLPSGKEIRYQGYEDQVILELLEAGLAEDEIITGPGNVPHITYKHNDKLHRYYPDIYIPKLNQLIEVKSKYTWEKYKDINLAKIQACKDAGYDTKVEIR
jgi:hypothetical protein